MSQGRTLIMIEHDMDVVFDLADRISVLVYGQIIASDVPASIKQDRAVQTAYLGTARMMLEVRDLHAYYGKSHILQGVSLHVGAGEIVSILGRNGVGRSTTLKAIMGDVPPHGSIVFKDEADRRPQTLRDRASGHRLRAGGPRHLPDAHRRAESDARPQGRQEGDALGHGDTYRLFPRLEERAADARPACSPAASSRC